MINPTFASFKSIKQTNSNPTALCEINNILQPKTFYQLKSSNNVHKNPQDYSWMGPQQQEKISFHNANQNKKPMLNFNLKKNFS